jgi:hypothetical protein
VEAFGRETPLTQRVRRVELALPGQHPESLLSQAFVTRKDFTISPGSLSADYDLLLGTRFIRHFRLHLMFNEPCTIRLTAEDGRVTHVQEEQQQEQRRDEHIEQEAQQVAALQRATQKPLSQSQRHAILREWRGGDEWSAEQARRAAAERPDLVMSTEELEQLWQSAPAGTVKVFTLLAQGVSDADDGGAVALNRLAHGKESSSTAAAAEDDGSLLPPEERERAARLVRQLTEREFAGVFPSELPAGLPPTRGTTPFRIELKPGTQPFGRYGPRMTAADTQEAEKMLKELLAKGFIRPSRSPWGSPMFLVEKPDGGKRMVIDYRALNATATRCLASTSCSTSCRARATSARSTCARATGRSAWRQRTCPRRRSPRATATSSGWCCPWGRPTRRRNLWRSWKTPSVRSSTARCSFSSTTF